MNPTNTLVLASILISTFLGACASTGRDRAQATANGLVATQKSIDTMIKAVDSGSASLSALSKAAPADAHAAFAKFSGDLATIESEVDSMRSRSASMKSNATAFFQGWEQEMASFKNAKIKEVSAERRKTLQDVYDKVTAAMEQLKKDGVPYLDNMRDIKTFFDIDLSADGISKMKSEIATVVDMSKTVKEDLQQLSKQIKAVEEQMGPVIQQVEAEEKAKEKEKSK